MNARNPVFLTGFASALLVPPLTLPLLLLLMFPMVLPAEEGVERRPTEKGAPPSESAPGDAALALALAVAAAAADTAFRAAAEDCEASSSLS